MAENPSAPDLSSLGLHDVHVWFARLRFDAPELREDWNLLDASERAKGARLRRSTDRARYASTRAHLRRLLAAYVGCRPDELTITTTGDGKPELGAEHASRPLHFNVSHSGTIAAIAVGHRAVGIDVERIRADLPWQPIATEFFSPSEVDELEHVTHADRTRAFFDCWVRKEAYLKAVGTGLRRPTTSFTVPVLGAAGDVRDLEAHPPPAGASPEVWSVRNLGAGRDYAAAVCTQPDAPITVRWIRPA